ncbi:hypothetical protein NE454_05250 [Blautia producta]|uniref:hypothetical protein n=1 Tax=Blautia producta TaxID=33035 RepID=UPI00210B69A2|nr:hypothetical protein [Blautia producta]MCQ5123810.1 hypothetical protein [Blautia producta]
MLELRRVGFFVDIGDNLLEMAKASQECREECKNLFISLGFQVDTDYKEKTPNFYTQLGYHANEFYVAKGEEHLRIMDLEISGNIYPDSLADIANKLRNGKTFHYKGAIDLQAAYILTELEAKDYYEKNLEAYEEKVIEAMKLNHEKCEKTWFYNPMAEFKEDILICVGYDAISFFHLKTAEVINDMLDKGLIKSDNSLLAPGYALPEFYTETGKYKLPHLRR